MFLPLEHHTLCFGILCLYLQRSWMSPRLLFFVHNRLSMPRNVTLFNPTIQLLFLDVLSCVYLWTDFYIMHWKLVFFKKSAFNSFLRLYLCFSVDTTYIQWNVQILCAQIERFVNYVHRVTTQMTAAWSISGLHNMARAPFNQSLLARGNHCPDFLQCDFIYLFLSFKSI